MNVETLTRAAIDSELHAIEDEIGELAARRDELEAALKRNFTRDGVIVIGPICIACHENSPEHDNGLCADCGAKVRQLLAIGKTPEAICGRKDGPLLTVIRRRYLEVPA